MNLFLKAIGCLLVLFTGILLGFRKSEDLVRRAAMLEDMLRFLRCLQTNLKYRCDTTAEALQTACHVAAFKSLPLRFEHLQNDTLPLQLESELQRLENQTGHLLGHASLQIFCSTIQHLGQEGAQEEQQKVLYAISVLQEMETQAKAQAGTDCKLYRLLGITGGAAAALLLL